MLSLLGIEVANWWMDTLQLAFAADENMQSKSLKECVRRWVPAMAGYSDEFDEATDKGNMLAVSQEDLVKYAGGDTDATFRLCKVLMAELKKDPKQLATVKNVQMAGLRMFYRMEKQGMRVSRKRLLALSASVQGDSAKLETELMRMVPKAVKQKHFDKGLSLSRKDFLSDVLFTKEGLNLKPINFVKTGGPATDKTHLLNFTDCPFVVKYMELQKLKKMQSTYIGVDSQLEAKAIPILKNGNFPAPVRRVVDVHPDSLQGIAIRSVEAIDSASSEFVTLTVCAEGESGGMIAKDDSGEFFLVANSGATGFWKHLCDDGKIHPSFFLHKTVTGRSSSSDPNFQNIPKRGSLASAYRRIFIPSKKGNVLLESDLSQAELRVAACESLDPTMMKVYREGGDIHTLTASKVARVDMSDVTKDMRQKAKAVNFGFLYTMGVDGFIVYAKTQYGVEFTKKEAQQIRETYFATYSKLKAWHERRRMEVRRHGFVRGLHGAKRNLPSIHSTDQGVQAEAERQSINSPVQRFASDCTIMAMVQFSEGCPDWVLPIGTVHDSGIVECPQSKHLKVASWLRWCMANPPLEKLFGVKLPVPMDADVAMGPDLGTMSELKVEAVKPPWIS
jgi:DNA polymerase I-like protein with 3'-5' exonuclease and polymerase domains